MKLNLNLYPFGRRRRNRNLIWKVIGGATLAAVSAGVVRRLPDLKRYLKV